MSDKLNRSRFGLLTSAMSLTASLTKGRGLLTALLVPCIVFSLTSAAQATEPVQVAQDAKDYVSEVLPYPVDEVYGRARMLFNSDARDYYEDYNAKIYDLPEAVNSYKDLSPEAYAKFMALPLVRPTKFYVFYGAYPNMQQAIAGMTPLAAMGHSNAALQRYAQLRPEERVHDLYIWSPDAPYWHSEYTLNGKPLPFKSNFILHLAAVDEAHTEAEIIENEPVVRLAQHMSVDLHGIVHPYEIREVEPTTSDREFLLSCLKQFIERRVPGRHWFSCRAKGEPEPEKPVPFTVP